MTTLPRRSIRSLYSVALSEGEGVGTAYEYFVKRRLLDPWLEKLPRPRRMLIAGLPEKYGSGLDLLLIAQDAGVSEVVVIDDREEFLTKSRQCLKAARALNELLNVSVDHIPVADLTILDELAGTFDLCLASEVLQRLQPVQRPRYVQRLLQLTPGLGLFVPNADNAKHQTRSGPWGLRMAELRSLIGLESTLEDYGYIDMPPWPPGVTKSSAQRDRMAHRKIDALAMLCLEQYARLERFFPRQWLRAHAHILYALVRGRGAGNVKV